MEECRHRSLGVKYRMSLATQEAKHKVATGELRALADIGSHWLDLMHFVTGLEIEAICADSPYQGPIVVEVEDRAYEGSLESRKAALKQTARFLRNFL